MCCDDIHSCLRLAFPPWRGVTFGLAWLGLAWLGLAWLGLAWLGLAWLGLAWLVLSCLVLFGFACLVCCVLYVAFCLKLKTLIAFWWKESLAKKFRHCVLSNGANGGMVEMVTLENQNRRGMSQFNGENSFRLCWNTQSKQEVENGKCYVLE
ncbi:hypothetical protein Tco_0666363 [Tanacetum coccineum]